MLLELLDVIFNERLKNKKVDKIKNVKKRKNVAGIKNVASFFTSTVICNADLCQTVTETTVS